MIPPEDCIDLASERLGGAVVAADDEFFAPKENLVKAGAPIYIPEKYTESGKWMDGWETRRWRPPRLRPNGVSVNTVDDEQNLTNYRIISDYVTSAEHSWLDHWYSCVIRLGLPGNLRRIDIDTSYFTGNSPSHASLHSCYTPSDDWLQAAWSLVLPKVRLQGGGHNIFDVATSAGPSTHVRLNIFPDGGVARLRVYGEVVPDLATLARSADPVDFASVANGGFVVAASDAYFGAKSNLIMPGKPATMGDGWETRRRREPGYDWIIVRLGARCLIDRIVVETEHFKGNYPDRCSIDACSVEPPRPDDLPQGRIDDLITGKVGWRQILAPAKLGPDRVHVYQTEIFGRGPFNHVRLNIDPDGGISRLCVFGRLAI